MLSHKFTLTLALIGLLCLANAEGDDKHPSLTSIDAIAANNREVRLVGPNQKEVEMKDDPATKVVVFLENLQQETGEVWGQVNEKLDKGWKDFKTMVENAVAQASKPSAKP